MPPVLLSSPLSAQKMELSIHDNYLISYEVRCKDREIILQTEYDYESLPYEVTEVVFRGVQGYKFENDAFGNIIYGLDEIPVGQIIQEYRAEITESYRMSGAPGPWASDLDSAVAVLEGQGAKGFILSSSYGISGWIIAREVSIHPALNPDARQQPHSD
jgi:hypothetical protein